MPIERIWLQVHDAEVRAKVIDEFVKAFKEADITDEVYERLFNTVHFTKDVRRTVGAIDRRYNALADAIADQLKGRWQG